MQPIRDHPPPRAEVGNCFYLVGRRSVGDGESHEEVISFANDVTATRRSFWLSVLYGDTNLRSFLFVNSESRRNNTELSSPLLRHTSDRSCRTQEQVQKTPKLEYYSKYAIFHLNEVASTDARTVQQSSIAARGIQLFAGCSYLIPVLEGWTWVCSVYLCIYLSTCLSLYLCICYACICLSVFLLICKVRQFNSLNDPAKAKFACLCTSSCCRFVKLCIS